MRSILTLDPKHKHQGTCDQLHTPTHLHPLHKTSPFPHIHAPYHNTAPARIYQADPPFPPHTPPTAFTQPPKLSLSHHLRNLSSHTTHTAVIEAYARSLRVTFISAIAMFVVANVLVLAVRLPSLKPKKRGDEAEAEAETGGEDREE